MPLKSAVTTANALVSINSKTYKDLLKYEQITGESMHDVIETALTEWLQVIAPVRISLLTRTSHREIPEEGWRKIVNKRICRA